MFSHDKVNKIFFILSYFSKFMGFVPPKKRSTNLLIVTVHQTVTQWIGKGYLTIFLDFSEHDRRKFRWLMYRGKRVSHHHNSAQLLLNFCDIHDPYLNYVGIISQVPDVSFIFNFNMTSLNSTLKLYSLRR